MPGDLRGSTVLAFESRRAVELEKLIRRNGGVPVVVPSMREVPLEENAAAFEFLDRLESGAVDVVIMLTGVGVRTLVGALAEACPPDRLAELLRRTKLVARGPKGLSRLGEGVSGGVRFFEGDQAAGELEEREVVLFFLRPADQDAAVAVEPGVAGLDDPASCFPARGAGFQPDLFSAGADVRGVAVLERERLHRAGVVAAVQTQPLRPPLGRLRPGDRDAAQRRC